MNPWRVVEHIGEERAGPRGGRSRLLLLSCGHQFAWRNIKPKGLASICRPPRFVPKKVRCLLCLVCDDCGSEHEVDSTVDPYAEDVHNRRVEMNLCRKCYRNRVEDI